MRHLRLLMVAWTAACLAGRAQAGEAPSPPGEVARSDEARRASEPSDPTTSEAGSGTIRGVVRDSDKEDEPVAGASIEVMEAGKKTTSASDGSFEIPGVPAGRRKIQVTKSGFEQVTAPADVKDGETTEVPVLLFSDQGKVQVITGKLKASARSARLETRLSASAVTVVSKEEIKQKTGGDVVAITKELPGVSTVDSKYVYVRGLGDRYSQTLVNGSSLPSPEPDKRVIPLDLFPSSLVESIAVVKTYSPDIPGEFSGGSVQVRTLDVPPESFFTLGGEVKYRSGTSFRDFKTYEGGNHDMFSFDDGTRQLPGEVPQDKVKIGGGGSGLTPEQVEVIGESFENIWNPGTVTAPLDHKLSMSFGQTLGGKSDGSLGIVGALTWANKYQTILDEKRRIVANGGTPDDPKPFVFSDYNLDSWTFEAELSALLNITYEINEGQKIGWRNLYTRSGEDQVRTQTGIDGQRDSLTPVDRTRLRWVERSLFSTQPFGEHLLFGDALLEWRASYALSQRDEPDNRQVRTIYDPAFQDYKIENVFGSGRREFYLLDENIYDAALDLSIPFRPFVPDKAKDPQTKVPEQKIKLGPAFLFRDRDFDARRFRFVMAGGGTPVDEITGQPVDLTATPEDLYRDKNIHEDGFVLEEETRPTDNYEAEQTIIAGYGLLDFRIIESLRLQGGVRVENSVQELTTFELFGIEDKEVKTELENTDYLPAVNLIWEFLESMQLRLSGSQTVSRPEFRELAPFEYTDVEGGYIARGNPNLERAKIWNADLGWEWYPAPGDIVSAGLFYKHFDKPIEVINLPTSSGLLTTWDNADQADLIGFEIEARKELSFILEDLKDLTFVGNFAYMESEVSIRDDPNSQQTNDKRPLQGQPEYLLNLGLLYESKPLGLSIGIFASTLGERISAVGASGIDDEYEQPRWNLDMSVTKKLGKGTLKITGENLLNDNYDYTQSGFTTREYRKGWLIGVSYSYTF